MSEREYTSAYLSDVPVGMMIHFECDRCQRAGQYLRETLLEKFSDGPLPALLRKVAADCPRWDAVTGARCGIHYAEPPAQR
jgi:hypothetical protein